MASVWTNIGNLVGTIAGSLNSQEVSNLTTGIVNLVNPNLANEEAALASAEALASVSPALALKKLESVAGMQGLPAAALTEISALLSTSPPPSGVALVAAIEQLRTIVQRGS